MKIKNIVYFYILPAINRLLRPLSLKLNTTRTPNRNFEEFFRHLKSINYNIKTVIDVGVGNGTESLYNGVGSAQYYLVEPVPDSKGVVKKISKRLDATFFNVAASDTDSEVDFNLHEDVTGSSMLKQLEDDERINGELIRVPSRRLDSIILNTFQQPCLLKIDTQGAELAVIKGTKGILGKIDLIICEVSFHQFRHGAPEISDVIAFLKNYGYVPYEILEGHYRSVDNALAQVDIVFIKIDSPLRTVKTFFSNVQSAKYIRSGTLR